MKGTDNIIAHINAEAKAKADAIIEKAEMQCADIREDYNNKAKAVYAEIIAAGEQAGSDLLESKQRIISMEAKKELLAVKQEMVSKVFDSAKERILDLPEDEYLDFLVSLVERSSIDGDEVIVLNANDSAKYGAELVSKANAAVKNGKFRLSDEAGDFSGGLILRRGNIEANCTVELLVELCKADMSADIAKILFS